MSQWLYLACLVCVHCNLRLDGRDLRLVNVWLAPTSAVHNQLSHIRLDRSSVAEYAIRFCSLAAISGWNEAALITAFSQGLSSNLVIYYDAMGLENIIQCSIRVAQRISACHPDQPLLQSSSKFPSAVLAAPVSEPMQVDYFHLAPLERQWWILNDLCLYCGLDGHLISTCPVCPPRPVVSSI